MRILMAALLVGLLSAAATADIILVPDEDEGIVSIQQAMYLATAGDTILLADGVFDSVYYFDTPLGRKSAICSMRDGVTLMGSHGDESVIEFTDSEYGIMCLDVGEGTRIVDLAVRGGIAKRGGGSDDTDIRLLNAGIACLENASPYIAGVTIQLSGTGILSWTNCSPTIEQSLIARGDHHGIYVRETGANPVIVDHVTIVGNFDYGIYVSEAEATVTNCSITHNGKNGVYAYLSDPVIEHCNVYLNDLTSLDPHNYGGSLEDLTGTNGNFSSEPFYCDYSGATGYNYNVCGESPNLGAGAGGTDVGAFGIGCDICIDSPVKPTSWSAIKALYR
jgi:hypothetical protein